MKRKNENEEQEKEKEEGEKKRKEKKKRKPNFCRRKVHKGIFWCSEYLCGNFFTKKVEGFPCH
jgi:hypothetical protein